VGEHLAAAVTWPLLFSVFVSGGGFEDRPLAEEPPDPSEQLASEPGGEFVVVVVGIAMLLLVVAGAVTIFSLCSPTEGANVY
jgi:hypothetical protein